MQGNIWKRRRIFSEYFFKYFSYSWWGSGSTCGCRGGRGRTPWPCTRWWCRSSLCSTPSCPGRSPMLPPWTPLLYIYFSGDFLWVNMFFFFKYFHLKNGCFYKLLNLIQNLWLVESHQIMNNDIRGPNMLQNMYNINNIRKYSWTWMYPNMMHTIT